MSDWSSASLLPPPGADPEADDLDGIDADDLGPEDASALADDEPEEEAEGETPAAPALVDGAAGDGAKLADGVGPSLILDFLAGTIDHLAASAPPRPAPEAPLEPPPPPGAAAPPDDGPPQRPTLDRALMLLRQADPDRLRARGARIAPLLARLRALAGDGAGP